MAPADSPPPARLRVTVVRAPAPRQTEECVVELAAGSCVRDALAAAGWWDGEDGLATSWHVGVWSRAATLDQALHDGDRVEWVRDLRVDPKVARRERFAGQGARTAGLFARRRPGSKSGY
jgi:putative ubiquitin-RnfH superfamily antitoxin RatB of RatAB toxin-antitoxin module